MNLTLPQHQHHPRNWRENLYVYPVISRRSRGLSIGVNLNPDTACNFDCIYCQVDRTVEPRTRSVELPRLREELSAMIADAVSGVLYDDPKFKSVPDELRRINDIAFSGDGEPTTCTQFVECVEMTARLKREAQLHDVKIVLITDACYLTKPQVENALAIMDQNNGQIWAKLDAGTQEYFQQINKPNYSLQHVVENITAAATKRPVVIQSMFMNVHAQPPGESELIAYTNRLMDITQAGGRIEYVQVYTVARQPAQYYVSALTNTQIDHIARLITDRTQLKTETFYGS